jgi:hypothetical protein
VVHPALPSIATTMQDARMFTRVEVIANSAHRSIVA